MTFAELDLLDDEIQAVSDSFDRACRANYPEPFTDALGRVLHRLWMVRSDAYASLGSRMFAP